MSAKFAMQSRGEIEYTSRAEARAVYLGDHRALCRVLGCYSMYVDTRDRSLSPSLMLDGCWEPWVTAAVAKLVQTGWTVVNVGANVGYYAVLLGDLVGPKGRVIAFEPNRQLTPLLHDNLGINGIKHSLVHNAALGNRFSDGALMLDPEHNGDSFVVWLAPDQPLPDAEEPSVQVQRIRINTLDDCIPVSGRVDFVLMDTEGFEETVWLGMERVLAENPNLITLLEFNAEQYHDPLSFVRRMQTDWVPEGQPERRVRLVGEDGSLVPTTPEAVAAGETGVPDSDLAMVLVGG